MTAPDSSSAPRETPASDVEGAPSELDDQLPASYDDRPPELPNPTLNRAARAGRPTEDEQLLESPAQRADPRDRTDAFIHTDPWRVLRIQGEFVAGFDALAGVGPAVSILGPARTPRSDPMYGMAVAV